MLKMVSKFLKIKAFKTTEKNFATIGISPKLVNQSYPLNGIIFMSFLILGLGSAFVCVYIFNYAATFSEYTQSIYTVSAAILIMVALIIIILQVDKLFEYIDCCDKMLNMCKFDTFSSVFF